MKKMIYRILALALDMMVVSLITLGLTYIPFLNPNNETYRKQYDEVSALRVEYNDFSDKVDKILSDKKISTEEYESLNDYKSYLTEYVDKDLSDDDITNFRNEAYKGYADKYNAIAYEMTKNNTITKFISITVTILYFGILQFILKGKTLGKLIFKLRVINSKDETKRVPIWSYLIRAILVGEILIIATDLSFLYLTDSNMYLQASNVISTVQYIYEILFLIVMMMREDQRSIHDLILGTRVALYDKDGKEIIEVDKDETVDEKVEVKEVKKENKKTTTKKKSTTKKKTKKEFVSAEKVDD